MLVHQTIADSAYIPPAMRPGAQESGSREMGNQRVFGVGAISLAAEHISEHANRIGPNTQGKPCQGYFQRACGFYDFRLVRCASRRNKQSAAFFHAQTVPSWSAPRPQAINNKAWLTKGYGHKYALSQNGSATLTDCGLLWKTGPSEGWDGPASFSRALRRSMRGCYCRPAFYRTRLADRPSHPPQLWGSFQCGGQTESQVGRDCGSCVLPNAGGRHVSETVDRVCNRGEGAGEGRYNCHNPVDPAPVASVNIPFPLHDFRSFVLARGSSVARRSVTAAFGCIPAFPRDRRRHFFSNYANRRPRVLFKIDKNCLHCTAKSLPRSLSDKWEYGTEYVEQCSKIRGEKTR